MTKKELLESIPDMINEVDAWFASHPVRRDCYVELWFGRVECVRRGYIIEDLHAVARRLIEEDEQLPDNNKRLKKEIDKSQKLENKVSFDEGKFVDDFWREYSALVPEHLRRKLSIHDIRFMLKAFLKALEKQRGALK